DVRAVVVHRRAEQQVAHARVYVGEGVDVRRNTIAGRRWGRGTASPRRLPRRDHADPDGLRLEDLRPSLQLRGLDGQVAHALGSQHDGGEDGPAEGWRAV